MLSVPSESPCAPHFPSVFHPPPVAVLHKRVSDGRRAGGGILRGSGMTALAIKDWATLFTKGDLARVGKVKTWHYVPIPINLNGERFRTMMGTIKGREAFAVFIALCELAANMPVRGVLADDRGPSNSRTISIKTGIPVKVVEAATEYLLSEEIGWLIRTSSGKTPDAVRTSSEKNADYPTLPNLNGAKPTQPDHEAGAIDSQSEGLGGGEGPEWNRGLLTATLTKCGVSGTTAERIATYAGRFNGFDVIKEYGRLRSTRSVASPSGALVKLMAKHAGIDLDTRSIAGELQKVIDNKRAQQNGVHT